MVFRVDIVYARDAVAIALRAPIVKVAAGGYESCVLDADGVVHCRGFGLGGSAHGGPVDIGEFVRDIVVYGTRECAITATAKLFCWGVDLSGELGYGMSGIIVGDDETPKEMGPVMYDPPSMSWDETVSVDFDEDIRDSYHAAAVQWSGAQGTAPPSGSTVAAIDFFSATWGQFVNVPLQVYAGVPLAALGIAWQNAQGAADDDVFAAVWSLVDTSTYLDTCNGVVAPLLEFVRVGFNTNFVWNDSFAMAESPNLQGVWVHEIGHMLGLPHRAADCPQASIMKPGGSIASTWTNWYTEADDEWRIRQLYPREIPFPLGSEECP